MRLHVGGSTRSGVPLLIVMLAAALVGTVHLQSASAEGFPLDAIGRLLVDDAGVCTAFVVRSIERPAATQAGQPGTVYENWLVSAGHCAGEKLVFVQRGGAAHPVVSILGFSAAGERGHDVLVGAFLTEHPTPTLEPAFGHYPQPGDRLLLIGYGRNALMMRIGPVLGYDERGHIVIENFASPGNSGGPVLIPGTRRVVGVGIETTVALRPGVPARVCQFGGCSVKPPYFATHIDHVRGVVSFR